MLSASATERALASFMTSDVTQIGKRSRLDNLWNARPNMHTNNTFKLPNYRESIRIALFASK
jgi:hypothetical protein